MRDHEHPDLRAELRALGLEQRAQSAEIRTAIAVLHREVITRFGALMDAVADLRRDFELHDHSEEP